VTSHALIEGGHRLISTTNLHLEESSFLSITSILRTLRLSLLCIVPSTRSTEDILNLLLLEHATLVVTLVEDVLVGTCAAFETVGRVWIFGGYGRWRDCEDIAARGADWTIVSARSVSEIMGDVQSNMLNCTASFPRLKMFFLQKVRSGAASM